MIQKASALKKGERENKEKEGGKSVKEGKTTLPKSFESQA